MRLWVLMLLIPCYYASAQKTTKALESVLAKNKYVKGLLVGADLTSEFKMFHADALSLCASFWSVSNEERSPEIFNRIVHVTKKLREGESVKFLGDRSLRSDTLFAFSQGTMSPLNFRPGSKNHGFRYYFLGISG